MLNLRCVVIALLILLYQVSSPQAQVSVGIGIGLPHVSIGINLPLFPELVPVPGYPVYYAPRLHANYFFYDGLYWVYQDDNWYASSWYNGPWWLVEPEVVPLFILRIPVRYYRQPPPYFRGWARHAPPRWGQHWGHEWEQRRRGWDRWQRGSAPARAPLPTYQRRYSGERYPLVEQQQPLHRQHYRYQPRDRRVRQHFQYQGEQSAPVQRERQEEPAMRSPAHQPPRRPLQHRDEGNLRPQPQQREEYQHGPSPVHPEPQQRGPVMEEQRRRPEISPREQHSPRSHGQEQRFQERGHGPEQQREEGRGRGRNN